jgi:hypothetical protein
MQRKNTFPNVDTYMSLFPSGRLDEGAGAWGNEPSTPIGTSAGSPYSHALHNEDQSPASHNGGHVPDYSYGGGGGAFTGGPRPVALAPRDNWGNLADEAFARRQQALMRHMPSKGPVAAQPEHALSKNNRPANAGPPVPSGWRERERERPLPGAAPIQQRPPNLDS